MSRPHPVAFFSGLAVVLAGACAAAFHFQPAERPAAGAARPAAAAADTNETAGQTGDRGEQLQTRLPLKDVVLFTSGVGYFERQASVEGNAQLEMQFRTEAINDLLKSLVVQDSGSGRISAVTYTSKAPASHVLKTFAVDLQDNPTMADLLRQLRGVRIQVESPEPVAGTIVSVEQREIPVDDDTVRHVPVVNLRTDDGLRSLQLEQIRQWRLVDPRLSRELEEALEVLRDTLDTDQKTVAFDFTGEGERRVRIGYVQQMPIWKMTYRLLLDQDGEHLLQGWAIVENTGDQDWNDVRLTLVSGNPISFVMPLYEPRYVDRPTVQLDLYESLRPPTYEQELKEQDALRQDAVKANARKAAQAPQAADRRALADGAARARVAEKQVFGYRHAVQARARGEEVGELFQYAIESPVSIPRQRSAMIPVINQTLGGEKLSIYDPSVHAKHPLDGLRLRNETSLFLMEGPLTVLDGGTYAGDALLEGTAAGAERLISYALDMDVEVSPESSTKPQNLVSVRLAKGTLYATHKQRREQRYVIKNSGQEAARVLVQHAKDPNWKLVSPEDPSATTRDHYRFEVQVPAGKTETLEVVLERTLQEQVALSNANVDTILQYRSGTQISDEVKQTLAEIVSRKREIEQLTTQLEQARKELDEIATQQERIRKNMERIDRQTELYTRYLSKLSDQEDKIETLQDRIEELQQQLQKKRSSLDEYLLSRG